MLKECIDNYIESCNYCEATKHRTLLKYYIRLIRNYLILISLFNLLLSDHVTVHDL